MVSGNMTPLWDNILVEMNHHPSQSAGGIIIPDSAKQKMFQGKVVAVGDGKIDPESGLMVKIHSNIGDNVIFGKYSGAEIKYNGINYQVIKDNDVLLKFTVDIPSLDAVECTQDHVLVRMPLKEMKSAGGILIPGKEETEHSVLYGDILKIGRGVVSPNTGKLIPLHVSIGDKVSFNEYAGSAIRLDKQDFMVVRSADILTKW